MAKVKLENTKAISVNRCWQGRRFKTKDYTSYETTLWYKLPKSMEIPEGRLCLSLRFGVSSSLSDTDNLIKPLQDILQKKYNFNDKLIDELHAKKEKVDKGHEFIEFEITNV